MIRSQKTCPDASFQRPRELRGKGQTRVIHSVATWGLFLLTLALAPAACGDDGDDAGSDPSDGAGAGGAGGATGVAGGVPSGEAGAGGVPSGEAGAGGAAGTGGAAGPAGTGGAGGEASASRYATRVVSFTPGPGAGFGQEKMPDVVFGPPLGGGLAQGSLDVVSLGQGGEIVLAFSENAAVDGPGVDFLVFENAFAVAGGATLFRELGEVSVSDDGATWVAFPCDPARPDEGACAGRNVVYANPETGVSALAPATAGGDPFDLALVGLARARFVRVRDLSPSISGAPSAGFDLDALALVHAETP